MKLMTLALTGLVGAIGCNAPVEIGSSTGGTGGANGGAGGTTVSISGLGGGGDGGTGGATASGGTGGTVCEVGGPLPCGSEIAGTYPDPLTAYVPGNTIQGSLHPIPGFEDGSGAGTARIGPFAQEMMVSAMSVVVQDGFPDPLVMAIWTEPQCGLPSDNPNMHAVEVPVANLLLENLGGGFVKATWTLDEPFSVPVGASVFPSLITTEFSVAIATIEPGGEFAPRASWFGIVDNDCDGEIDPDLGYAGLDTPSAPGVSEYHYDLGFAILAAPAAPPPPEM